MTPIVWIAVALLLVGAIMLLAGIEATGLWIVVITVGIALVVICELRGRHTRTPSGCGRSATSSAETGQDERLVCVI